MLRRIEYEAMNRAIGPLLLRLEEWERARRRRGKPAKPGPFGPPLECTRKLKELMSLH